MFYFENILKVLVIIVPLLVSVALFTVAERKILSSIQRRRGPNVIGIFGLLQAFADGLKLLVKETILPSSANKALFILAPLVTFFLSLIGWAVIPVNEASVFSDLNVGILYLFAISSLGVYGIIISGWASNSKYAFLGALRSAAQMVSYEISIGFIIINVILCSGSLNLSAVVLSQKSIWFCIPLLPMFILFFVSCLAETNRHPFDLPEAEAELVSGYNVEYSAIGFALFFLGEYGNIILISSITVLLFIGGWLFPFFSTLSGSLCFSIKTFFFIALFIWVRAAFPRYRYDQLMRLGWKVFLPFSISWVIFTASILSCFNWYILCFWIFLILYLLVLICFLLVSLGFY
ncbi:MAG: NADH-quinone oxidoreductase subunit NuoH [Phycisphaerae bacterium]|nr:NADH-quinone oxidoreductase subunit NuoH [Phycisphaerae bacterium]